jgi:mevalonate kinase
MVEAVANLKAQKPGMVDDTFDAIRALVRNARWSLETGDKSALGRLMDANQNLLAKLGVSTPTLDRLCNLARDAGAHGAKLTGAGGGGCVVALVPSGPVADQVLAAWHGAGFQGFATRVAPADAPGFALTKEASP